MNDIGDESNEAEVINGIRQDCDLGVWDNACDEAVRREIHTPDGEETEAFADGAEWGAGWAFAIIGMAEAIRHAHFERQRVQWRPVIDEFQRVIGQWGATK